MTAHGFTFFDTSIGRCGIAWGERGIVVPCHRVLAASGKVGGFSANGGIATKLRMLSIEAAQASGQGALFEGDGAFGFDPAIAVEHLRASDEVIARLIDAVGPFRMQLRKARSIFVALAEAIVYQQLNGRAAASIFARVCALFPVAPGLTAEQVLRISDQKLRGAGLSNSKLLSIRDLARKSVDDYGIRAGFAAAFRKCKLPAPKDLVKPGANTNLASHCNRKDFDVSAGINYLPNSTKA